MNLEQFFSTHRSAALAFSVGVDSAYLLYAALHYGCDVHAYYVKSAFQPDFETEDAIKLCKELGARMTIIDLDILSDVIKPVKINLASLYISSSSQLKKIKFCSFNGVSSFLKLEE